MDAKLLMEFDALCATVKWNAYARNMEVAELSDGFVFRVRVAASAAAPADGTDAACVDICSTASTQPLILQTPLDGGALLGLQLWVSATPQYALFRPAFVPFNAAYAIKNNVLLLRSAITRAIFPERLTPEMLRDGTNLIVARMDSTLDSMRNTRVFFVLQRKFSAAQIARLATSRCSPRRAAAASTQETRHSSTFRRSTLDQRRL